MQDSIIFITLTYHQAYVNLVLCHPLKIEITQIPRLTAVTVGDMKHSLNAHTALYKQQEPLRQ